jgi:hypothetical protein
VAVTNTLTHAKTFGHVRVGRGKVPKWRCCRETAIAERIAGPQLSSNLVRHPICPLTHLPVTSLNLTTIEGIAGGTTFSTKIRAYLILTCQEQRTHSILVAVDRKCQAVHRIFTHSLKIHTRRSRNKDVQAVSYCVMGYFEVIPSRRPQSWRITTACIVSLQHQDERYHLATVS